MQTRNAARLAMSGGLSAGSALWSGIARTLDKAPWKTPAQLVVEKQTPPLHELAHGQTLPVFIGAASIEGIVFWRDGPRIETSTTTSTDDGGWKYQNWQIGDGWPLPQPAPVTTTITITKVYVSFAVAHSFNQFQRAGKLLKVEFDDVVVYDASGGAALPAGLTMRVYDGIDNGFDPTMLSRDGEALTPAYHGLRYLFFEDVDLAAWGGAIPASIRILWGDAATASGECSSFDTLATAPNDSFGGHLSFDLALNRYYGDFTGSGGIYIETVDLGAHAAINIVPVSGGVSNLWSTCAIPGTGLLLGIGTTPANGGANSTLLIDCETGELLVDHFRNIHDEVEWVCALPLAGAADTTHIAAGVISATNQSLSLQASFIAVDVTNAEITDVAFGVGVGSGQAVAPIITPGTVTAEGTTFYVAERNSGNFSSPEPIVWEFTFTDVAPPAVRQVAHLGAGKFIKGIYYDATRILVSYQTGLGASAENFATALDAATGAEIFTVQFADGDDGEYQVITGGGAWDSARFWYGHRVTARLRRGFALLDNTDGGNDTVLLMDLRDGSYTDLGTACSLAITHYDQLTGTSFNYASPGTWTVDTATGNFTAGPVTLADELTTFSTYDDDRGGLLTDAQVTTEGLDGIVNGGVILNADTDLRELSGRLAELYGVLRVETATGVKWVLKGRDGDYSPDVTLTEADLVEERRGEAVVKIATRDRNPKEIPAEVEVRYISSDAGYDPLPARAAWPQGVYDTALTLLKRSLSVPVVLTDAQALELAWGLLARSRAAIRTHSLVLRPNRLKIEPSDVFEITAGGQAITGMFTKQTLRPDLSLEMTAEGFLSRAATTVTAETPIVHEQPDPSFATRHVFLDTPLIRFSHDGGGTKLVGYSMLTGLDGWPGGSLYRRRAGETTWTKVAEYAGQRPVVGVLTAALPASPWPFETDTENDLTFRVVYGDADLITAQTEAQFYDNAGQILAVGAPGRWIYVTCRNKTVNADGTITMDTLRQGLKGSEVYEGTSQVGDRVVLVKPSHAQLVTHELGDLGETVQMKAVAFGVDPNGAPASSFTISGAADTPRAPGNLAAAIDGADIDLTWDRRSRLLVDATGDFGDGDEAPLGADLDVYEVEILDGPGGTVVRTYSDVSGEAKTYSTADVTADFGVIPDNLTFRVRQKTSITGIGYGHAAERSVALQ